MMGLSDDITIDDMFDMKKEEIDKIMAEYKSFQAERKKYLANSIKVLPEHPPLVLDAIHYMIVHGGLDKEGIFRVNGDSQKVDKIIKAFSTRVDTDDIFGALPGTITVFDVATALKSYFRKLQDPLVPYANYNRLRDIVDGGSDVAGQARDMQSEIGSIKEPNLSILSYVMMFFQQVVANSAQNKMNANNMATCLTMSITRFMKDGNGPTNHFAAMMEVGLSTKIIAFMLSEVDWQEYLSPEKFYEMLRQTNYRTEDLPYNMEEFKAGPYYYYKPRNDRNGRAPPVVPPRNKN